MLALSRTRKTMTSTLPIARHEPISVCIPTYNGSKYILQQIDSILPQLRSGDEVIICDDASSDATPEILKSLESAFLSVYFQSANIGLAANLTQCIRHANNRLIALADQDDLWPQGRLEMLREAAFISQAELVIGRILNFSGDKYVPEPIRSSRLPWNLNSPLFHLLSVFAGTANCWGCAMMIKKDFLLALLPLPEYINAHDIYIYIAGLLRGTVHWIDTIVTYRRLHEANLTARFSSRPIPLKIADRLLYTRMVFNVLRLKLQTRRDC